MNKCGEKYMNSCLSSKDKGKRERKMNETSYIEQSASRKHSD